MKTNIALHIYIAENGGHEARVNICKEAKISLSTLKSVLDGHIPRFEARYRIYKLTGIKLCAEDDFPELPRQNAS
jgi:hypothetical protein